MIFIYKQTLQSKELRIVYFSHDKKKYLKNLSEKHKKKTIMLIINKWPVSNLGGQHIYIPNEKRTNIF